MNMLKYKFWSTVKQWVNRNQKKAYMEGGNCDSCCPKCKQWESAGNSITTDPQDDGSEHRTCYNCQYEWKAIFTPVGFIPTND